MLKALSILLVSGGLVSGQAFTHNDLPWLASPSVSYPQDMLLWVDSTDVLGTNSPMQNGDIWTNVVDKSSYHRTLTVNNGLAQRYFNDGSSGLANGIPSCRQTNTGVGSGGGFSIPFGWVTTSTTNFTMILLCNNKQGPTVPVFFTSQDGSVDGKFAIRARNGGPALQIQNINAQGANGTFTTNIWRCLTIIQSNAFLFVYTNGVLNIGPTSGTPSAPGGTAGDVPTFYGQHYSGASWWWGDWCRAIVWDRALFGAEKTYWENRTMNVDFGVVPGP